MVNAASTISTDISTGGTLTVTGNSVLTSADIGGGYSAGGSGATITAAGKLSVNGDLEINGMATTTAASGNIATQGTLGVATTTPSQEIGVAGDAFFGSSATTTVFVTSTGSTKGGCLQLTGTNGTTYRIYVGGAGTLVTEAGSCQ